MPETTYESDFQVEYEEREPLVCQIMNFKLDKRAEKRKEFDDMMTIKMNELNRQKEMAAMRKLEAENRRYVCIYLYTHVYMYSFMYTYI
jgi:Fe-S-cluster containining protein